jgi:predicted nucleic acid-binding protein
VYLVDTNVISELRKPRPHGAVLAWLQAVDNANLQLA